MVFGLFNNLRVLYSFRLDILEKYGIIIRMEMIGFFFEEMDYIVNVFYMFLIDFYYFLIIL